MLTPPAISSANTVNMITIVVPRSGWATISTAIAAGDQQDRAHAAKRASALRLRRRAAAPRRAPAPASRPRTAAPGAARRRASAGRRSPRSRSPASARAAGLRTTASMITGVSAAARTDAVAGEEPQREQPQRGGHEIRASGTAELSPSSRQERCAGARAVDHHGAEREQDQASPCAASAPRGSSPRAGRRARGAVSSRRPVHDSAAHERAEVLAALLEVRGTGRSSHMPGRAARPRRLRARRRASRTARSRSPHRTSSTPASARSSRSCGSASPIR